MKALSVRQPWASLIACGAKTIETRVWGTTYRGPLLIVSGLQVDEEAWEWMPLPDAPLGAVVGICDLVDVHPMTIEDEGPARCRVYPRAKAWVLQDAVKVIDGPKVRGTLGLFEVEWP